MENIKLKSGVYAVVNTETGDVLAVLRNRDNARAQLQYSKSKSDFPSSIKLLKMTPGNFVR